MKCIRCDEDKEPKYPPSGDFVCAMCCYDAVYGVK